MSVSLDQADPAGVDAVLARFDACLDWAKEHKSRLGYFPALYRGVTLRAVAALSAGAFDNPVAAERLVVHFAGRYFEALAAHSGGRPVTRSWQVAFAGADRLWPTVTQHLLLGINAHINLDLGIAAARTHDECGLEKSDFDRVNGMLVEMVDEVQDKLAGVWPLLRLLDWLAGRLDETIIGAGLRHARAEAWEFAQALQAPGADRAALIEHRDRCVAEVSERILSPGPLLTLALGLVRLGELRFVRAIIELLMAESADTAVAERHR